MGTITGNTYENILFFQGEPAEPFLEMIRKDGEEATLEVMKEFHFKGNHETTNELLQGDEDSCWTDDRYIMSYNLRIGYIGLQYRTNTPAVYSRR